MKTLSLLAFAATLLAPAAALADSTPAPSATAPATANHATVVAMTKKPAAASAATIDQRLLDARIQAQTHQLGATN